MRYVILHSGPAEGRHPTRTSAVQVRYEGSFANGQVFDTSVDKGTDGTAVFPLRSVIPGFMVALQMMRPGDQWLIYIPSELAYGDTGKMAGKDLIFRLTLIDFAEMPPQPSPLLKELPKR